MGNTRRPSIEPVYNDWGLYAVVPLLIQAQGRHSRQLCRTNTIGFPDKAPKATSVVAGLRTGDMVRAVVPPPSKKAGTSIGRIAIRATEGTAIAIRKERRFPPFLKEGVSAPKTS